MTSFHSMYITGLIKFQWSVLGSRVTSKQNWLPQVSAKRSLYIRPLFVKKVMDGPYPSSALISKNARISIRDGRHCTGWPRNSLTIVAVGVKIKIRVLFRTENRSHWGLAINRGRHKVQDRLEIGVRFQSGSLKPIPSCSPGVVSAIS